MIVIFLLSKIYMAYIFQGQQLLENPHNFESVDNNINANGRENMFHSHR
jgi:hypothetical protein